MNEMEMISFTDEDGKEVDFFVEEQTRMNGYSYLLVTESQEDEAEAYILKDLSADGDEQSQYVMVEDELELESISRVFEEMLEDVEIKFE